MDFAWVVDALRSGLKVTRKAWLLTNSTMYLKMVKNADLSYNVARIFCMGRQASTWCPTQAELFEFTDWEEYVEPKKEPVFGNTKLSFDENGQPHMGDTMHFDSICKGCFNCLWRKKGQNDCGDHPNLVRNAAGIVTECSSWILRPDMTEDVHHDGQAVEDQPDIDAETNKALALVARNIAEDLVELLQNPSVLRLLQKTDVPLSREDTNHV